MITEIPTENDFTTTGLSLLGISWDTVSALLTELANFKSYQESFANYMPARLQLLPQDDDFPEISDAFWEASRQQLATALVVAQQGVEFILKGCIAKVSPFLLINGAPKDWPKGCNKNNTSFAEFNTIDAQDLVKTHDTVAERRLPDGFVRKYNDLRSKRNAIMHTVDKRINLHAKEVIVDILSVYKHLFPGGDWVKERRKFLEKSPVAKLDSPDFVEPLIIGEFSLITELLEPNQMKKFFGFNKGQRRYICPVCYRNSEDSEIQSKTAVLKPNTAASDNLYCFVCDQDIPIEREDCPHNGCLGNVLSREHGICTTCGYVID